MGVKNRVFAGALLLAASGAAAYPQSIYVDLDIGIGGADLGSGAPSSAYGAAAAPGYWNRVQEGNSEVTQLRDTSGNLVSVFHQALAGNGIGYNNPDVTGDAALLLRDAVDIGSIEASFTLSGLLEGDYEVLVYAVPPQGYRRNVYISATGSLRNPQLVTGPLSGNDLYEGVTYARLFAKVRPGEPLQIFAKTHGPRTYAYVNGFQVVLVPEPLSCLSFAAAVAALFLKRRRGM